jgi:hypothetical protein
MKIAFLSRRKRTNDRPGFYALEVDPGCRAASCNKKAAERRLFLEDLVEPSGIEPLTS